MSHRLLTSFVLLGTICTGLGCEPGEPTVNETSLMAEELPSGLCPPDAICEVVVGVPVGVTGGEAKTPAVPSAELPCNNVDEDLDGSDWCGADRDGDGVQSPVDCNDDDPSISQRSIEALCDGVDQNCDGVDDCDRDGDGVVDRMDFAPDDPEVTHYVDPNYVYEPLD